jgi:hypothetical protein
MRYLGVNRGQAQVMSNLQNIQVGTVSTGTDMELRWDNTKPITKLELRQFTELLEFVIENGTFEQNFLPPL